MDGQHSAHYVIIYNIYPMNVKMVINMIWALSPLESEHSQSTKGHFNLFSYILIVYSKKLDVFVALIGDNYAIN